MAELSYTVKRVVFTLLLFALLVPTKMSGQTTPTLIPSGKYKITIDLKECSTPTLSKGDTLYLRKFSWDDLSGIIIDSAILDRKLRASFVGPTYPIATYPNKEKFIFTAGQYNIYAKRGGTLLRILYSSSDGNSVKESYRAIPSEKRFQQYERVKGKREKKISENDIIIPLQYYNRLRILAAVSSDKELKEKAIHYLSKYDKNYQKQLAFQAEKEVPNSLAAMLLNKLQVLNSDLQDNSKKIALADERILYTSTGMSALRDLFTAASLRPDVAESIIDYLLTNRYLTYEPLKNAIISKTFEYFSTSKMMADASGAVYVAKKYILPDETNPLHSEASYYVLTNESTLLGKTAPPLALKDTANTVQDLSQMRGETTIIYFFSDDCNYCKEETPRLVELLNQYSSAPINLYTVYTGTDEKKWKEYLNENFTITNPLVIRTDVADLSRESDFPVSYGVVSTPKMFLLDYNQRIIGRNLRTSSLNTLLQSKEQTYQKQIQLLSDIFPQSKDLSFGDKDIAFAKATVDKILSQLYMPRDEETIRLTYLYLASSNYYPNQEAAAYLGEKYICGKMDEWKGNIFAERVCDAVRIFKMNKLGEKATDVQLYDIADNPASLLWGESKKVLFFYSTTCGVCSDFLESIKKSYWKYGKKVSFTGIYVGSNKKDWRHYVNENNLVFRQLYDKEQLGGLAEKYDISSVPHIYLLDGDNTVIAKDISADYLATLLEETKK